MSESNDLMEQLRAGRRSTPEITEESRARREVADALRGLLHGLGRSDASAAELRDVARALRAQAERVVVQRGDAPTGPTGSETGVPGMHDFHDRSPIAGHANAVAPPATLAVDADASIVVGEVTFGPAFEGAPGCVHGGFVAAVLDEALGMASAFCGKVCMTAELTTRYRRPTPISALLRVEARLLSAEGRKVLTSGEVYHGDDVLAEGSGIFITVDTEKFAQFVVERSERQTD